METVEPVDAPAGDISGTVGEVGAIEPAGGENTKPAGKSVEEVAREKGWRPKEEFSGEEAEWVDAQEFIRREPLFEKIRHQSKEMKKLQKTIEGMVQHYHADVQAKVQQQLAQLRAAKKEAIELGDVQQVDAIERQISQTISQAPKPQAPVVDDALTQWVTDPKNKWFNEDQELRDFAIAHNETWLKRNPGKVAESLKATEDATRRAFPEKFPTTVKPPSAESGAQSKTGVTKFDTSRLTPEQKMAYRQFVTVNKIMSHDEYFKSLEEIGALS